MPRPVPVRAHVRAHARVRRAHFRRLLLATLLAGLWFVTTGEAVDARAMMMVEPPPPPFDPRIEQAVVTHRAGPAPLAGGTLTTLSRDRVLVADADEDRVLVVATDGTPHTTLTVSLPAGSEPGRSVEDENGRVHVVLRGTGEVLSLDPSASREADANVTRRAVCAMPRGLGVDRERHRLLVACRTGELAFLPTGEGDVSARVTLEPDLRDVVLTADHTFVSRFRSAELLEIDRADGHVLARRNHAPISDGTSTLSSAVAWRALPLPTGEVAMIHQRERDDDVVPAPGGYGGFGGCDGIVKSTLSVLADGELRQGPTIAAATLPIDLALRTENGQLSSLAIVAAGNQNGGRAVLTLAASELRTPSCTGGGWVPTQQSLANAVAVTYLADGRLAVQARAPSRLVVVDVAASTSREVSLGGGETFDTGHAIFHAATSAHIACASCHPEGGEDGHTWRFSGLGPRRTPALHDVAGTAPFHWEGDLDGMDALVNEVFVRRMNGVPLDSAHTQALEGWLGHVARPRTVARDAEAVARGRAVFQGAGGCTACHSGEHLSDNQSHDVGTGRAFQTPTLRGVSARLPVMHDGCAHTLRDRFTPSCGGERHGGAVEGEALDDLLAYLASL